MHITIDTTIPAPLTTVWSAWTTPADITHWNAASDDWCCPAATIDLRPGGHFSYRMEARDGSFGFDFAGTFTTVVPHERIEFTMGDERIVTVEFVEAGDAVTVRETFEAESTHTGEQQRQGWQAILDRFAAHVISRR
ncbi:MAG: SRPBCC family protein [Gemmatimonadaceae bacterium]|nr:SRPBCC family protein [Gemmatimonadaceae bacterium]